MKKKLLFVAAMAALLMGVVSCGTKSTPLEKVVNEVNAILPEDDNEFIITSMEYETNHVTVTYDANKDEAEFVDAFIDGINNGEGEEWEEARLEFIPEMLAYHFDYDVLLQMVKSGAGLTAVYRNEESGKTARLEVTSEELKSATEIVKQIREEDFE